MEKIVIQRIVRECAKVTEHPLLQRIFAARGVEEVRELQHELKHLLPFHTLKNVELAAQRLARAVKMQERILIVGDFDCDGATATAVAVLALKKLGAKHVDFIVPNRFEYGYGLTPEIVELAQRKQPQLIVTVDNGISSLAGVAKANEFGIDVIVTDHHLAGNELPNACAIVNPNQPGDLFPSKNLAGVGVIFYVMLALRKELQSTQNMAELLDLVALGTVADVVKLDHNNRILVQQGLLRIRSGECRMGIRALLEVAKRNLTEVIASDLSFGVGPRLNAAGRLDDMSLGIRCLLSEDLAEARLLAQELNDLNLERRELEVSMKLDAFKIVEQLHFKQSLPVALCLFDPTWHQGIVGLVASRVKDQWHRPVIAFAELDENWLKGSARSIPSVHIRYVFDAIATQYPELLQKFGGHAMAAGLTIAKKDLLQFSKIFADEVGKILGENSLKAAIETDGELTEADFTVEIADLLKKIVPWGQGFPEPLFHNEFNLIEQRLVGERHLKLTLQLTNSSKFFDGIWFNVDLNQWPNHRMQQAKIIYRLETNEYQGLRKIQLVIDHIL